MAEQQDLSLDIVYRPVWETAREDGCDLFYALPVMRDADGAIVTSEDPLKRKPTVEATAAMQMNILRHAFSGLDTAHLHGDKVRLIVPVNSLALTYDEIAGEITDMFRQLGRDMRQFVTMEVLEFPKALGVNALDDITIPLMPFFDKLLARPEPEQSDYTLYANLNYAGVTLNLGDKPIDLNLAGQILKVFMSRAEARRLPAHIVGLGAADVANVARLHEAAGLTGSYMELDSDLPGPILSGKQPFMV